MRNLLMALLVVGLLAAPSLAIPSLPVSIKLTTDVPGDTLSVGQMATITLWAQADNGVYSVAGSVVGSAPTLSTNAGSFAFDYNFQPAPPFSAHLPAAGTNGGIAHFGTTQTAYLTPDSNLGKSPAWTRVCYWTVTGVSPGDDTLVFQSERVYGFYTGDINKTEGVYMNYPVTVHVTPEPMSLALLALGGLLLARRRA